MSEVLQKLRSSAVCSNPNSLEWQLNNSWHRKQDLSIPGKQQCCLWGAWGHGAAVSSASSARTAFIHFISDRFWIFLIRREKRRGGEVGRGRERNTGERRGNHISGFSGNLPFSYPWLKGAWGGRGAGPGLHLKQLHSSASLFMCSLTSTTERKLLLGGSEGDFQLNSATPANRICRKRTTEQWLASARWEVSFAVGKLHSSAATRKWEACSLCFICSSVPFLLIIWVLGLYVAGECKKRKLNTSNKTIVVLKQFIFSFILFYFLYSYSTIWKHKQLIDIMWNLQRNHDKCSFRQCPTFLSDIGRRLWIEQRLWSIIWNQTTPQVMWPKVYLLYHWGRIWQEVYLPG